MRRLQSTSINHYVKDCSQNTGSNPHFSSGRVYVVDFFVLLRFAGVIRPISITGQKPWLVGFVHCIHTLVQLWKLDPFEGVLSSDRYSNQFLIGQSS